MKRKQEVMIIGDNNFEVRECIAEVLSDYNIPFQRASGSYDNQSEYSLIVAVKPEVYNLVEEIAHLNGQKTILYVSSDREAFLKNTDNKDMKSLGKLLVSKNQPKGVYTYEVNQQLYYYTEN